MDRRSCLMNSMHDGCLSCLFRLLFNSLVDFFHSLCLLLISLRRRKILSPCQLLLKIPFEPALRCQDRGGNLIYFQHSILHQKGDHSFYDWKGLQYNKFYKPIDIQRDLCCLRFQKEVLLVIVYRRNGLGKKNLLKVYLLNKSIWPLKVN